MNGPASATSAVHCRGVVLAHRLTARQSMRHTRNVTPSRDEPREVFEIAIWTIPSVTERTNAAPPRHLETAS
jgi:hypothetical protein